MNAKVPVVPVPLSNDELKRILHWAQAGGHAEIEETERKLATHLQLSSYSKALAEGKVTHEWTGTMVMKPRDEQIEELRARLAILRKVFWKLMEAKEQNNMADIEQWAKEVAGAVKDARRAERKADNDKKVVG